MSAPISDERLVELLLDRGPEAESELAVLRADLGTDLGTDPAVAARLAALERLLGIAAAAVQAPAGLDRPPDHGERERALAERILRQTTREDLSWRGDLHLVQGYVRARLRESRLTRVLAALLVGNLAIGPVLAVAWVLVHEPEPERELFFRVEPSATGILPDDEARPGDEDRLAPLDADAPAIEGLAERDWLEAQHVENRLRRARYLLAPAQGAVPAPRADAAGADASLPVRLLDVRARLLAGSAWPEWLDDAAWAAAGGGDSVAAGPDSKDEDLVAAALYVEVLLDRFVLTGERAPRFHGALAHLAAAAEDASASAAARRLAAAALARAGSYGLRDRGSEPPREDPIDAAWRADLAAALGAQADDPVVRAWTGASR